MSIGRDHQAVDSFRVGRYGSAPEPAVSTVELVTCNQLPSSAIASGIQTTVRRRRLSHSMSAGPSRTPGGDLTVDSAQVTNFLATLRDYSDNCVAARKAVEDALQEGKKRDAEWSKNSKKLMTEMKKMKGDVMKAIEKHDEEISEVRDSIENVEARIAEFHRKFNESVRMMERMEVKESFVCSYADICKESERLTRRLYTRTLYVGTICREIATACLDTLEGTIRILQSYFWCKATRSEDSRAMTDVGSEAGTSSGGRPSIATALSDILLKTRYLKKDVQTVERAAELMEEVCILDKTLQVSMGEVQGLCLNYDDLQQQRKRVEGMVRISMEYNEKTHGNRAEFDRLVAEETDKRLNACGIEGSSLISAVVSTLKRDGPLNPGNVPDEAEQYVPGEPSTERETEP